jgi:hypothetical protein
VKWFTREWASGDLTDEQHEAAMRAYDAHLQAITPSLPNDIRSLLGSDSSISLHDASFIEAQESLDELKTLTVDIFAFDYEKGVLHDDKYWTFPRLLIRIIYYNATVISPDSVEEFEYRAGTKQDEIIRDEIDRTDDGNLEHRFLLHPWESPYVCIQFRDAAVRIVRLDGENIEIVSQS